MEPSQDNQKVLNKVATALGVPMVSIPYRAPDRDYFEGDETWKTLAHASLIVQGKSTTRYVSKFPDNQIFLNNLISHLSVGVNLSMLLRLAEKSFPSGCGITDRNEFLALLVTVSFFFDLQKIVIDL